MMQKQETYFADESGRFEVVPFADDDILFWILKRKMPSLWSNRGSYFCEVDVDVVGS